MKTNEIQFGGKSYVCRIVEANGGEELLIAPTIGCWRWAHRTVQCATGQVMFTVRCAATSPNC